MSTNFSNKVVMNLILLLSVLFEVSCEDTGNLRTFLSRKVEIEEVPFIVLVLPEDRSTCTGFIVSHEWVITAAHCFDKGSKGVRIAIGTSDRAAFSKKIAASEIIIHPEYDDTSVYDIALIKLGKKISITTKVQIIGIDNKIWPTHLLRRLCYSVGFGYHIAIERTGVLHGGQVSIGQGSYPYSCEDAKQGAKYFLWTNNNESEPICFGDSGSPLVCNNLAVGVAVISFVCGESEYGVDCTEQYVDGYVSLQKNFAWLKKYVNCLPSCSTGYSIIRTISSTINLLLFYWIIIKVSSF